MNYNEIQYTFRHARKKMEDSLDNTHVFTRNEEIANAVSHAVGVMFSLFALVLLMVFAAAHGSARHIITFAIYGLTMLLLYTSSTLLHALPHGRAKNVFEILDHSSIYLFIAGTYTPILLLLVKGWVAWTLFGVLWGIAAAGIVFKVFFVKRFVLLSTVGYILMGWQAVFVFKPLIHTLPLPGTLFLVAGGVFYTIGSIFYVWRHIPYHHLIWHLSVLAGSVCHFILILRYVDAIG